MPVHRDKSSRSESLMIKESLLGVQTLPACVTSGCESVETGIKQS